jgi:ABC-type glycerol-3-phosphate transport system substrate-binding protein
MSKSEENKISRRKYLQIAGGTVAGLVVGGALGYVAKPEVTAPPITVTSTVTETVTGTVTAPPPTTQAAKPWDLAMVQMNTDLTQLIDTAVDNAHAASIDWMQHAGETVHVISINHVTDYDVRTNNAAKKFKELSGIDVIIDFVSPDEARQKSILTLQSKSPAYDIVEGFMDLLPAWGPDGIDAMEPLDTFMNDPKLYDAKWFKLEDLNQPTLNAMRFNGKLYAFMELLEVMWLNYRKDLFQKYGVTSLPNTFEELYEAAGKCNHPPDVYGNVSRGKANVDTLGTAALWVFGYGGDWFSSDWQPTFNQGGALDGLDMYTKTLTDYGPLGVASWGWEDEKKFTMLGKVATNVCSCWRAVTFWSEKLGTVPEAVGNIWFAPPPKGPKYRASSNWSNLAPINKYSKNKEAAWLWYMFKHSQPVMAYTCASSLSWSRDSVYDIPSVKAVGETLDDYGVHIKKARSTAFPPTISVPIPEWAQIGDMVGAAISSALAEEKTIKQALDDAADKARQIMKDAGYYKLGVAPYQHPPPPVTD